LVFIINEHASAYPQQETMNTDNAIRNSEDDRAVFLTAGTAIPSLVKTAAFSEDMAFVSSTVWGLLIFRFVAIFLPPILGYD
jgi:hypothetical protein